MANTAGTIESWQRYDITVTRYGGSAGGGYAASNDFSGADECIALWRFETGSATVTQDSKGNNHLYMAEPELYTIETDESDYIEGESCLLIETPGAPDYNAVGFRRHDVLLDAGYPLKSGDTAKKYSVTFWIKPNAFHPSSGYGRYVYSKGEGGKWSLQITLHNTAGSTNLRLSLSSDGSSFDNHYLHGAVLQLNRWYHVCVTYEPGDYRIRVWDDEAQEIVGGSSGDATGSAIETYVGDGIARIGWEGNSSDTFSGRLDEITVWNKVLSVTEIDQIRQGIYGA